MPLQRHAASLDALERRGLRRHLTPAQGHDFSSIDYLGLANSAELRQAMREALERGVPAGAGGSRLLRGNHGEHDLLEEEASSFFGAPSALYMGGGFVANAALFSTLPQHGDLILHDALIHASAHDGMRASKAAFQPFPHNDATAAEDAARRWRETGGAGQLWIAVESLYSMDGDRAPLADLVSIARRFEAVLLIDEAHATGVFGPDGRGLAAPWAAEDNVILLHTCGKALGVSGALICAPAVIKEFLINRCRAFIYATAPSPLMAAGVRAALRILRDQPERRNRLFELITLIDKKLQGVGLPSSGSQIQPVIIGDNRKAMRLAEAMRREGFDIRGVRPPAVPDGTARLRLSLTLNVNEATISAMIDVLALQLQDCA